ncbi:MAG: hypothetical protein R3D29_16500 [Nitratireductor sp.]
MTLIGGRGADILIGGDGIDAADYEWSDEGVTANLEQNVGLVATRMATPSLEWKISTVPRLAIR